MLRSNRGAARVSAVWLISVGVVALAAVAFAFIAQSDMAGETQKLGDAQASEAAAVARFEQAAEARREASLLLGWYDRASADPAANLESGKGALDTLRQHFSDLTATDVDFETVLPKVISAYDQRGGEIAGLQTQILSLKAEVETANSSVAQVQRAKDQIISDLRAQISDEQQNSAERQQELEDRVASVQQQLADSDSEARTLRSSLADQQRTFEDEKRQTDATIVNLRQGMSFASEESKSKPDGKVLEVSSTLPVAWIDLGANQRVARGMRFEVKAGNPGQLVHKAWAEVTRVDANRAEVAIKDLVDRYDPVAPGDVVVNELYDAVGTRNAVLAGNFSGQYSRPELIALLDSLGVKVQEDVDYTTHFLIVGSALFNDPETNEPLDEPLEPSELAVYKRAEAQHVQIVPLGRIRQFFRLGV